ncbi:MAG: CcdB family protein [Litorimonas sp.]
MKQHDVFVAGRDGDDPVYAIVMQHPGLYTLETVFVAPLVPLDQGPAIPVINPSVSVLGENYFVAVHEMSAIPKSLFRNKVCNLEEQLYDFGKALDRLFSGI